jgi:hypothetical protein
VPDVDFALDPIRKVQRVPFTAVSLAAGSVKLELSPAKPAWHASTVLRPAFAVCSSEKGFLV